MHSIAVIVLNWNGKQDTVETLGSLRKITYPSYRVILVDNGSTDGSPDIIREMFPEVTLIETGENLGFAGGNNVGIDYALKQGADAVLLLNNDVEVDADFLNHLTDALYSEPDIGAVNPKIYYHAEPNVIWSAGGTVDYQNCTAYQNHLNEPDIGQADEQHEIGYAIGCAVLVKREVLEKMELLNPDFFMYYEETEWCHRIRQSGYRILYVPRSRIWHKVSRGMADRPRLQLYYFTRNRLLFAKKCCPSRLHVLKISAFDVGRMSTGYAVHRKLRRCLIVLKAVYDFYRMRFGKART